MSVTPLPLLVSAAAGRWPAGLGPRPDPALATMSVHAPRAGTGEREICTVWASTSAMPSFIAKVGSRPGRGVVAEQGALRQLCRWGVADVPIAIGIVDTDDALIGLESALPGGDLRAWLQDGPDPRRGAQAFEQVARWLDELAQRSRRPMDDADAARLLGEPLSGAGIPDLEAWEAAALAILSERAGSLRRESPLPVVFEHGDLGTTNVLVDGKGELRGVVDWEMARPGLPLSDLLYLARAIEDDIAASPGARPGTTRRLHGALRTAVGDAATAVGVPLAWVPLLDAAMLAGHAANEARRHPRASDQQWRPASALPARRRLRRALAAAAPGTVPPRILVVAAAPPDSASASGFPRVLADRLDRLGPVAGTEVVTLGGTVDDLAERRDQGSQTHLLGRLARRIGGVARLVGGGPPLLVTELTAAGFDDALRAAAGRGADLVVLEHALVGDQVRRVRSLLPGVPIVYSEHDVELHRAGSPLPGWPSWLVAPVRWLDRRSWGTLERDVLRDADMVLVPTDEDRDAATAVEPSARVVVVPFGAPSPGCASDAPRDAATLLFVGGFDHAPNVAAATVLVREVFPRVRERVPSARVVIVGRDPGGRVAGLAGDGVLVTGEVPEVTPYLCTATVFVAPIRNGGGTRVKVLEALAHGVPVVTTPLGAAGTAAEDGRHLVIAEVDAMAGEVVRLLGDPPAARRLAAAGRAHATDLAADLRRTTRLRDALADAWRLDDVAPEACA